MDKPIEEVLQLCLQDLESGRASIEDCLKAYPAHAAELAPILKMVQAIPRISWSEPSPAFRVRGRQWLEREIAQTPTTGRRAAVRLALWDRRIARLLAAGADEITAGRVTVADFLARHPAESGDLEPLLRLAFALPTIPWDGASPEFAARARASLLIAMDRIETREPNGVAKWLRRETLDQVLAVCADDIASGRATVADCVARHPRQALALAPLLRIVAQMPPLPETRPTEEFRLRARRALLDKIEAQHSSPIHDIVRGALTPRKALTAAAAGVAALALVTGSAGAVLAAQDSQPGDTLYPVKTASEQVRIFTAPNDAAKAQAYITVLDHRVDEMGRITAQTPPSVAESIASAYAETAQRVVSLGSQSGTPNPVVTSALQKQEQRLMNVEETAPPTSRPAVTKAIEASQQSVRIASQNVAPVVEPKETVAAAAVPPSRTSPQRVSSPSAAVVAIVPSPAGTSTPIPTATSASTPGLPPGSVPAPAVPGSSTALTPGLPPGSVLAPAVATSTATVQATPGLPPGAVSAPNAPTPVITPGLPPGSVPAPGSPTPTATATPTVVRTAPR